MHIKRLPPPFIASPNRVSTYRERELTPTWTRLFIDELADWAAQPTSMRDPRDRGRSKTIAIA